MIIFHPDGSTPEPDEIFVFGSNLMGFHGRGAAAYAHKALGFPYRLGHGYQGRAYALPTKDHRIQSLSLREIKKYVDIFLDFAYNDGRKMFLTAVGCGLAGYKNHQIAPMFKNTLSNISYPEPWRQYL